MSEMNIDDLDFRHLLLLDSMIRHHSVSAAANELDIAQPKESHSLARSRRVLDDPLLVRAGGGMEQTPRDLDIAPPSAPLLALKRQLADTAGAFATSPRAPPFLLQGPKTRTEE